MKCNTTLEGYKSYYSSMEFQENLMRWFKVSKSNTKPKFPWIGFADRHFNEHRPNGMPAVTREKSFYFSFCVFFHCLQAQAIFKLSGCEVMYRFHAETGVPMISCGLGGVMHPAHTLDEAELLPEPGEIECYIRMINTIQPAIRPQVEDLGAYAPVEEMYSYVENEILAFRDRLSNGENHPTYLEQINGGSCFLS